MKACNYGRSPFFLAVTIPHESIAHNFSISAFQCKEKEIEIWADTFHVHTAGFKLL